MILPRHLPLTALLAAGLLGFTACADNAADTKAPDAPVVASDSPAEPVAEKTATDANPSGAKKLSPEEQAKADARREINRMSLEKVRLDTEMQIAALRERAARSAEEDERAAVEAAASLRAAKIALENAKADVDRADRDRTIAIAALKASLARRKESAEAGELESAAKLAKQEADNELLKLSAVAAHNRRESEASKVTDAKVSYVANPVIDGTLHISDRRIFINGLITDGTAAGVITKLNFFSLADPKAPVFVVMETVPGGNAMASYQIMKAIESCPAPVHVVVKSTVGGSASAIVAAAPFSYTLPNSRIVFQQPATPSRATTLGSQRDGIRVAETWYDIIHKPVATKAGMSTAEFAAETYKHSGVGDWLEFGDKAVDRKWVNTLVERIVEDSVDTLPAAPAPSTPASLSRGSAEVRADAAGNTYFALPPIAAGDQWMVYDPQHLYRSSN